jgi:glycosyltransferase involved in cell wall biosynthesis
MRSDIKVIYICNLLSEQVILRRGFTPPTMTCTGRLVPTLRACRDAGVDAWALSMGRGRQQTTGHWHPATVARLKGVPVIYAAFWDIPILTHFVSLISLGLILWRLRRTVATAVFWNAVPHYLFAFAVVRLTRIRCVLDLEDGIRADERGLRSRISAMFTRQMDSASSAAMVANAGLKSQVRTRPAYCFYGVAPIIKVDRIWGTPLQVLFSGHLSIGTGVQNFLEALSNLRQQFPEVLAQFNFVVVGGGELAEEVRQYAAGPLRQSVEFLGRVSDNEYQELLRSSHIGLCLKMPDHSIGQTTFPSKVIEFASWGLLVISHRVSDIALLLPEDGGYLLENATSHHLVTALRRIAAEPERAAERASRGRVAVTSRLSPKSVGADLARLWGAASHL